MRLDFRNISRASDYHIGESSLAGGAVKAASEAAITIWNAGQNQ